MYPSFNKYCNESIISITNYVKESWQKNSPKANVRHQHADFLVEVTEHSNGANTNKTRKIDIDELSEHIPAP